MKTKIADSRRLNILGNGDTSPAHEIGAVALKLWRRRLGYFSLFAGAASIFTAESREVWAREVTEDNLPPRIAKKAKIVSELNANCSKPEFLRRQSEYRLPHQKGGFDMVVALAGSDNCPGFAVPAGNYTVAAPYTNSGDTTGANNTVWNYQGFYYYAQVHGPDHIYSFTLTARGASPRIEVSTTSANYDLVIYVLNGLTGNRCPAGMENGTFAVAERNFYQPGGTEFIESGQMNNLPLNVPLHLFVDCACYTSTFSGPYTIKFQDVTIADSPVPPSNDAPFDMNGDGKSDFVIARNTGGGSAGQMTWFTRTSNDTFPSSFDWGLATDKLVPADFDADGKEDFAVWRPGAQGRFYIIQSLTQTLRIEELGQTGDDPSVVADYTGDGLDDLAVYRDGATPGAQSFWFYRSIGSPLYTAVPWGQHGDRPAPGNYPREFTAYYADRYADFAVQRRDGANGRFYIKYGDWINIPFESIVFGSANDTIAPGDYDGDGYTDIAVVRPGADGILVWDFEPSATPGRSIVRNFWGVAATDVITQGDYDGDGKTELSVWRPGSPGTFFQKAPNTGQINTKSWGQTGDIPVASYNTR